VKINEEDVKVPAGFIMLGLALVVVTFFGYMAVRSMDPMTDVKAVVAEFQKQDITLTTTDLEDTSKQFQSDEAAIVLKVDTAGKQFMHRATGKAIRYLVVDIDSWHSRVYFKFYDEDMDYLDLANATDMISVLRHGRKYQDAMEKKVEDLIDAPVPAPSDKDIDPFSKHKHKK
jgi:hypothetical protein